MLVLFLIVAYCFIGLVLSVLSHIAFAYAHKHGFYERFTMLYHMISDRDFSCPVLLGIFWPFGLLVLLGFLVPYVYEFISSKAVNGIESFLKKEEK